MKINLLFTLFLVISFMACKNDTKTTVDKKNNRQETQTKVITTESIPKFDGTWRTKSSTSEAEVILTKKDDNVSGTLMYKEFNPSAELTSSTGLLSLIGKVENGILRVDIYDPRGQKASTAEIALDKNELTFKLTGNKINYPDQFTAQKIE